MKGHTIQCFLALLGGVLLVLMMNCNHIVAIHTSPFFSSWVIHFVGAFVAIFLVFLFSKKEQATRTGSGASRIKIWSYLGGIPGALAVVLAAITINSPLGLAGTFALILVGQIIFGIICDLFGLLGSPKKPFIWKDALAIFFVLCGSGILLFFKSF